MESIGSNSDSLSQNINYERKFAYLNLGIGEQG